MTDPRISITDAKKNKLFYIVANIIIVKRADATCLLLQRSTKETVYPGKWAFPGGKLEHGEVAKLLNETSNLPIEGVDNILGILAVREAKEECGLDVSSDDAVVINQGKVFVRDDHIPVFMTTLATSYGGGSVVLEADAFSDHAWVNVSQLASYDCIDGVPEEAKRALELLTAQVT